RVFVRLLNRGVEAGSPATLFVVHAPIGMRIPFGDREPCLQRRPEYRGRDLTDTAADCSPGDSALCRAGRHEATDLDDRTERLVEGEDLAGRDQRAIDQLGCSPDIGRAAGIRPD